MEESLEDFVASRRLRWLGHVARMEDDRLPKKILFGWLPQKRPAHGAKMRWRDKVRKDLKNLILMKAAGIRRPKNVAHGEQSVVKVWKSVKGRELKWM